MFNCTHCLKMCIFYLACIYPTFVSASELGNGKTHVLFLLFLTDFEASKCVGEGHQQHTLNKYVSQENKIVLFLKISCISMLVELELWKLFRSKSAIGSC